MKKQVLIIIAMLISASVFSLNITVYQADSLILANSTNSCFKVLDVRTPSEFAGGHIQNALNIDYYSSTFSQKIRQLDKNYIYLVHCQAGSRSIKVMDSLQVLSFQTTYNMIGGYLAWKSAGFQVVTDITNNGNVISKVEISPNPVNNYLGFKFDSTINTPIQASVYNVLGKLEKEFTLSNASQKTDIKDLKEGIYFVIVNTGTKKFKLKMIVSK